MANTRKPAKGPAPKGAKTVEEAMVVDEKDAVKAAVADDKGAKTTKKTAEKTTEKTTGKTTGKTAEKSVKKPVASASGKPPLGASKAAASDKAAVATPAKDPAHAKTVSDKPSAAQKEDAAPKTPTSDSADKPKSPVLPTATPADAPRRSVFVPMILGGAIAAVIGFGAARYPDQWPFVSSAEDPMAAELSALDARLLTLEGQSASQGQALATLQTDDSLATARGEITGEFAQLRTQLEAMNATINDLESRLHTVEKLPQGSGMEAAAAAATAYERELQQMREMLDQELAKISAAKEDAATLEVSAAEAAKAAGARAALARVLAAIDTGRPYGDALFDLTEQAGVDAPAALAAHADTGVITLSALQAAFPSAARAALDASVRAAVAAGEMDRVSAFVRLQLGTRSLEPKDGTDADAILSRAESALKAGQIDAALSELTTLPDAGKPALEGWVADATARKDALAAGDALSQLVNKN